MTIVLILILLSFLFNVTATTEIYTLSLHDALPILTTSAICGRACNDFDAASANLESRVHVVSKPAACAADTSSRSEEHTSELQSRVDLVCRLLLEKKKKNELVRYLRVKQKKDQLNR